jgi:hypothetical protein
MEKKEIKKRKSTTRKKRGRPTTYNSKLHPKLAEVLASTGRIDKEVAKEIGISEVTLISWKKKYPEFAKALKKGKDKIDDQVESALYRRAVGYEHPEDKIFYDSKRGITVVEPTIKHYPPDTGAICFWLKNRRPEKWRDRQELEINGDIAEVLKDIFSKKDKKIEEEKK